MVTTLLPLGPYSCSLFAFLSLPFWAQVQVEMSSATDTQASDTIDRSTLEPGCNDVFNFQNLSSKLGFSFGFSSQRDTNRQSR